MCAEIDRRELERAGLFHEARRKRTLHMGLRTEIQRRDEGRTLASEAPVRSNVIADARAGKHLRTLHSKTNSIILTRANAEL